MRILPDVRPLGKVFFPSPEVQDEFPESSVLTHNVWDNPKPGRPGSVLWNGLRGILPLQLSAPVYSGVLVHCLHQVTGNKILIIPISKCSMGWIPQRADDSTFAAARLDIELYSLHAFLECVCSLSSCPIYRTPFTIMRRTKEEMPFLWLFSCKMK